LYLEDKGGGRFSLCIRGGGDATKLRELAEMLPKFFI
jgi:hypothetical protein